MSSRPTKSDAYTAASNPVDTTTAEQAQVDAAHAAAPPEPGLSSEHYGPDSTDAHTRDRGGVPSALAVGAVHGGGPADALYERGDGSEQAVARPGDDDEDAEKMVTLAEGKVATAVERKSGSRLAPGQKAEDVNLDDFAEELEK